MPQPPELESKLHEYLVDTHAMERIVLRQLDAFIAATDDELFRAALKRHKLETQEQIARLDARLAEHYEDPSEIKEMTVPFVAFITALRETLPGDKPARHAKDAFVIEHLEIAAYEILERLAEAAGDPETSTVARRNRAEEEAMAHTIAAGWDRIVEETLREEGALAQATGRFATQTARPARTTS
jgi:ferritin-like metal-binding protein YciE